LIALAFTVCRYNGDIAVFRDPRLHANCMNSAAKLDLGWNFRLFAASDAKHHTRGIQLDTRLDGACRHLSDQVLPECRIGIISVA
jgi:hypothetical protein